MIRTGARVAPLPSGLKFVVIADDATMGAGETARDAIDNAISRDRSLGAPLIGDAAEAGEWWGYQFRDPSDGLEAVIVRCAKHTQGFADWQRIPIPRSVRYAACPCGSIVRDGVVTRKDAMAIGAAGEMD